MGWQATLETINTTPHDIGQPYCKPNAHSRVKFVNHVYT